MSFEYSVKAISTFLFLALSSSAWGDVFDFVPDADTANGGSGTFTTTTTQSGVTMTYSTNGTGGGNLVIVDGGGAYGTTDWTHANGTGSWTIDTITFSQPIDITSFYFTSQTTSYVANFTVTQGNGTAINNYTVVQGPAPEATITPTDWTGVTEFTISSPTPVTQGSALDQLVFTIANAAPTIGGTAAAQPVNDIATVSLFSGVTISDAEGDNVTTKVTLDDNAKGLFTAASLVASGFTGTGPYSLALTTPANAQAAIRQLFFDPTDNRVAPGSTETTTFTITVNDGTADGTNNSTTVVSTSLNDNPEITSDGGGASAAVNATENQTAVTTVTSTDVDSGESATYSITDGADAAKFNINSSTGELTFLTAPDFENPSDSGLNGIYEVQVTVTDGFTGTDVQDIAVTLTNTNDYPVITSNGGGPTAGVNAAENQTAVTTVEAADQDNDTLTYSITGGADQTLFSIDSSTGVLTFVSTRNYESPTDSGGNNIYDVQVTVKDDGVGTLSDVQDIAVTVTNVNEAPVITSNGGGATASTSVNENTTAVTTLTATDVDSGDTLTYSISGGADAAKFSINSSTGVLTFASAPDYESPTDSGANNVYDVQVTVTDSGAANLTDIQTIAVTVNNVNEAPVITGQATLTTQVDTALAVTLGDLTVTDPDNSYPTGFTLTLQVGANYSLSGNTVTPALGYIGDLTVPATVNDGTNDSTAFNLLVTVTLGNTAPTISGTPATGIGDDVPYSFVPTASDADGDPLTFSILNKPAWASFNTSTGALTGTPTSTNIGTTTAIVISVSDGSLSDSLAAFDLEVYADLDNDNIADSVDTDDDGDGMSDNWESANGLNPRDATDAGSDADGDGVSNLDEFLVSSDPKVDDYPPVVTPPADVTVDAVGLFTAVSTGTATAVDALDGGLAPTSDAPTHFAPGAHTVTWSATDAAGNTGTAIQTVNVVPQVSFSKDQATAEGSTVTFRLILNGPAVSYPVTIPYTVGGTTATDGSDHTLADGSVVIAAGTEATVSFTTVDDGAGEGTEQIVVTMGVPTNAVPGVTAEHTIDVVEGNVAPVVQLSAEQGAEPTLTVVTGNGPVTVSSTVNDPNIGDVHGYDWSGSDNALSDTDVADDTFTFDPSSLAPGLYTLRLSVSDGTVANDALLSLNVVATAPALSAANDSDGDGADDAAEGHGDADGDGVADYLDAIGSSNVLQELSGRSDTFLMEVEPGLLLRLGDIAFRAGLGQAAVTMSDVTNLGGVVADDHRYDGGLFDFIVEQLPVAGQSIRVVLPQQAAIPAGAHYRKLINGLWQDFVVDAANSVASAAGEQGYCPPPGDTAYAAGLTEGHWCVQLTLEDGGPNDADGVANNSVVDPGGVAVPPGQAVTVEVDSGGGAASPWLLTILGLLWWRTKLVRREVA